ELRQKSIEHLGQVRLALMELDGNVSVYFQADEAVRPGLSILPTGVTLSHPEEDEDVECAALVSCCQCGHTMTGRMDAMAACPECRGRRWGRACASRRIG